MKRYLQKQLEDKKGNIVWLASYPKSGNTWFRCFLSALFNGTVELSELETDGIFSSRSTFDEISGVDSRLLYMNEVQRMIPEVFKVRARVSQKLLFVKIHDAYIKNDLGHPIVPKEGSHKVIYIVRNPLDVVGSFANHNASTIDKALGLMTDKNTIMPDSNLGMNIDLQLRQVMLDWSGHVNSWVNQKEIEVIILRYEDMLRDSIGTFGDVMKRLDIEVKPEDLKDAVEKSSFDRLKKSEAKGGFKEKNINTKSFFRSGTSGKYKSELTKEQIDLILETQSEVMASLNYLPED